MACIFGGSEPRTAASSAYSISVSERRRCNSTPEIGREISRSTSITKLMEKVLLGEFGQEFSLVSTSVE
ncbi:hypothetical protein T265_03114 [Opisthorchis viverrini]|uniref:Uncharacterized protein n=1 Tax=Opisthorchis viverrini TaxID=6198 RepID=A0A074ZTQ7_OPIVI|nr:hypothetical protein T265_03114 [Opisthorchis viverrini]KER30506.1 hypothetical protein T265_03114 [Opisthorchis viverrini]